MKARDIKAGDTFLLWHYGTSGGQVEYVADSVRTETAGTLSVHCHDKAGHYAPTWTRLAPDQEV